MRHGLIALWCLVALGCAQRTNEPTEPPIAGAAPSAAGTTPLVADAVTPEPRPVEPLAEVDASTGKSIAAPEPAPPPVAPADIALEASAPSDTALEASVPAALGPGAPVTQEFEPARGRLSSSVASRTSAETLDLSSLFARLRKTNAINLRTKVAVKHESDDLLEQFRAYHAQHGVVELADLRRSYDSLFHRLHSLLEDADPPLAREIDQSRAAIWELLADPRKFSASALMTGA
jgi:hypothetical protein